MPEKDSSNSIGDPEPFDADEDRGLLKNTVIAMVAVAGGLVVIPALLTPTRLSGASHASKIKWQQRQCEVDQAIAAQSSGATDISTNSASTASEK